MSLKQVRCKLAATPFGKRPCTLHGTDSAKWPVHLCTRGQAQLFRCFSCCSSASSPFLPHQMATPPQTTILIKGPPESLGQPILGHCPRTRQRKSSMPSIAWPGLTRHKSSPWATSMARSARRPARPTGSVLNTKSSMFSSFKELKRSHFSLAR